MEIEHVLELYYDRLLNWSSVLTRGDEATTQDIVHDLCLYFTLAKPDLSQVKNLDGYLYTCLKNIYTSSLARASREAMEFVDMMEFDSIHLALQASDPAGLLQSQNDLRRICNYAVWRKESSKSASYLLLLFFHGYTRSEVATIACLPIAAIYNKLKTARSEIKTYLEQPEKVRPATRDMAPPPTLRLSPVSSVEFFEELRGEILKARHSECLPEEELLQHYQAVLQKPIPCALLAHLVSCEHCLALLNRHFQWPGAGDRALTAATSAAEQNGTSEGGDPMTYEEMMLRVREECARIQQHRPGMLSIAVDGEVAVSRDVQSARSTLSARIEPQKNARFVEVFGEQRIRLALLNVSNGLSDETDFRTQRIALSDDRWLELNLRFDGLSLQSEVTYFDPALGDAFLREDVGDEESTVAPESEVLLSWRARILRYLRSSLAPRRAAWATGLALVLCVCGYLTYRSINLSPGPQQVLSRSLAAEAVALKGRAQHQILQVELVGADERTLEQGTIDVWKDGPSGRSMRRIYNAHRQLLAAEWRDGNGNLHSYAVSQNHTQSGASQLATFDDLWRTDLSAAGFRELAGGSMQVHRVGENYELTSLQPIGARGRIATATLVLDRYYRPISETLHMRGDSNLHEARFVQTGYETRPSASVPNSVFIPDDFELPATDHRGDGTPDDGATPLPLPSDGRAVALQISVLYELSKLGADVGEPIVVTRTPDGHVHVAGTIANEADRQQILTSVQSLPDHELLDMHLASQHESGSSAPARPGLHPRGLTVYDFGRGGSPADSVLNRYFARRGGNSEQVNAAVTQFSRDTLGHAQRALQHAYALERLGESFTSAELQSTSIESRRKWTEMAARHATDLEKELEALKSQLAPLGEPGERVPLSAAVPAQIGNPAEFSRAASQLLRQVQLMNGAIGRAFTSSASEKESQAPEVLVRGAMQSIPLAGSRRMMAFASQLDEPRKSAPAQNRSAVRR